MLSYENFKNTIRKNKREFAIPNKIYDDGIVSIGEIKSNKDVSNFPIKHHWCIRGPKQFAKYTYAGNSFYLIDSGYGDDDLRYAVLMIRINGYLVYWNMDNFPLREGDLSFFLQNIKSAIPFINDLCRNKVR